MYIVHSSLVLIFLQSKSKCSELQHTSSSGDRVHGTTNVVEYSVVGLKVGTHVSGTTCIHVCLSRAQQMMPVYKHEMKPLK